MYESFFGLREKPFSLLPDPSFFYLSKIHQEALTLVEYGLHSQAGFTILTGEIGSGKTTLMRYLLDTLDPDVSVGLISNTHHSLGKIMDWVCAAFALQAERGNKLEQHQAFVEYLIAQYAQGKRTLLIVDEAQNLDIDGIEEIRLLSNINADKDLVLQLLLLGQPQLREQLRQPALEQFVQRVSASYHLGRLTAEETFNYIRHRLKIAGGDKRLFSVDACDAVFHYSKGVPRIINLLCETALVYAFGAGNRRIEGEAIDALVHSEASHLLVSLSTDEPRQRSLADLALDDTDADEEAATTDDQGMQSAPGIAAGGMAVQADPEIVQETRPKIDPALTPPAADGDDPWQIQEAAAALDAALAATRSAPPHDTATLAGSQPADHTAAALARDADDTATTPEPPFLRGDHAWPSAIPDDELGAKRRNRWTLGWRRQGLALAAGLLLGVGIFIWLNSTPSQQAANTRDEVADAAADAASSRVAADRQTLALDDSSRGDGVGGAGGLRSPAVSGSPAPALTETPPDASPTPMAGDQTAGNAFGEVPGGSDTPASAASTPSRRPPGSLGDDAGIQPEATPGSPPPLATLSDAAVGTPRTEGIDEAPLPTSGQPSEPRPSAAEPSDQRGMGIREQTPNATRTALEGVKSALERRAILVQWIDDQSVKADLGQQILFGSGSTAMEAESEALLADIAGLLQAHRELRATVIAHSDSSGPESLNQRLSEQRAAAVAAFLASAGVAADRVSHLGKGESEPKFDPTKERLMGAWINRRIEILLQPLERASN